jgi:hypothetical protein
MLATRSLRKLSDATIEKLLGDIFSMRSVPRCYKQDKYIILLFGRQSSASKVVNTEAEEATTLKAVARQ